MSEMTTRATVRVERLERAGEQVVGQRPLRRQALQAHRDRARLPRSDPDGQVALAPRLLEDDDVAAGEHVDPHALDDHLDQPVVVHAAIIPRPHWRPAAPPAGRRGATSPTSAPNTKPPMWAKKATTAAGVGDPEGRQAVDELQDEPEHEHDDRRDVDELVEEARGRRAT